MKTTLIVTVFNEEKTIKKLLDSLLIQTTLPDEVVIVDAGSKDKTFKIIESYRKKLGKVRISIFSKKGNRSVGRNYAIKKSSGSIIIATDAGCFMDKNWVKNITMPFEDKNIDVVAGYYKAKTQTVFQKCLATYTCTMPDKVTDSFLPSSRSIAFRKSAWIKVGGYPEELDYCEDLVYAKKLKQAGCKFYVAKNAVVYWPQRKGIIAAFWQFYNYARGDGEALYIRLQTPLLFMRVFLTVLLIVWIVLVPSLLNIIIIISLIFLYSVWSITKNYKYAQHRGSLLYLPTLQVVSDLAVFIGMSIGMAKIWIKNLVL